MYDRGLARATGWPARRPSAMSLRVRCDLNLAPTRSASRPRTSCPALCLVPAYSGPGLPRPAMSHRSSAMIKSDTRPTSRTRPGRVQPARGLLCDGLDDRRGGRLRGLAKLGVELRLGLRAGHVQDERLW